MSSKVCGICSDKKFLCEGCQQRYDLGELSLYDVLVARALYSIMGEDASFEHAVDTRDCVVIVSEPDAVGDIIGRHGANIRQLEAQLDKKVKVLGSGDVGEVAKALAAPARLNSVNTAFMGGRKKTKVHVKKEDRELLRIGVSELERLLNLICEDPVDLIFD